jgi:dolichol-phosphate mannosyltransferase
VVPTYREAENLPRLVPRISSAISATARSFEIIIVDDNSADGTDRAVAHLQERAYPVRLVTRVEERDLSTAVLRGFAEARGETLACMDADLSHPPEAIPALLRALEEPDVEFALGSRYVAGASTDEQWAFWRRLNSKVATALARPLTSVNDPLSGFFAVPRLVYERAVFLNPIGYKIALELIVKCRCRAIREVPIHFGQRQFGKSKLFLPEQLKYLRQVLRLLRFRYCTHRSAGDGSNE